MDLRILKQARARRQFKALVRLVIANREWLSETLKYSKKKKSDLEMKHRVILNKNAADRTEEERLLVYRLISSIRCFRKYPDHVKMLLAGHTYFAYFGPDRVVVKQHQEAKALYFIVKGEVSLTTKTWDPQMNEEVVNDYGYLVAGYMFGEDSLLQDIPRQMTVTTATSVEFLILHREDFDLILRDSVKQEWDYITNAMKSFSYFETWDDLSIRECCMIAKVQKYEKDDTILGDGKGNKNCVYFLLKGSCRVIEHLFIESEIKNNTITYQLHNAEMLERIAYKKSITTLMKEQSRVLSGSRRLSAVQSRNAKTSVTSLDDGKDASIFSFIPSVEVKFMQVCIFYPKACFGLGEAMDRRRIVAWEDVECLVIPRYFIITRGQNNVWNRIRSYLNRNIPCTKDVFFEFEEQRKWRKVRTDMVERSSKIACNVPQNIPYSIRIRQDFEYRPLPDSW